MTAKELLKLVVSWRIGLTIVAFIAIQVLPFQPSFPYYEQLLEPLGPRILNAWANFDGVHYLTIIEKGYFGTGSIQAFFPLYPYLTKIVTSFIPNPIIAAVIISTTSFYLALLFLYRLVAMDESDAVARKTIYLLLLAPTAFFFTAFYTESIFLLFVVLAFYQARKKSFVSAGLFGALAAATRLVGIFLIPALLVEVWLQRKSRKLSIKDNAPKILASCIPATGLLAYMSYLHRVFNDSLLFIHVQSDFGVERQVDRIILLYQVFWRYAKMVATVTKHSLLYYNVLLELSASILFLILILSSFKHTRKSYAVFAFFAFIAPTLTGTFTSMPRYILVLFPAFILISKTVKDKQAFVFILAVSSLLLIINTMLFIQGYWVA